MANLTVNGIATKPASLPVDLTKAGQIYFFYANEKGVPELVQYDAAGNPRSFGGNRVTVPTPETGKLTIDGTEYTIIDPDDYYTKLALASVTPGDSGATKIAIAPITGVTGTNIQAALASLKAQIDAGGGDVSELIENLASTDVGEGAGTIGIHDAGSYFTGNTVEVALQEAGAGILSSYKTILQRGTALIYDFYKKANAVFGTDTPDFTLNLPNEIFIDGANTKFYDPFVAADWITAHPAATPAEQAAATAVNGKPVMVLAVKSVDAEGTETSAYSFLDMSALVDIVTAGNTDSINLTKDASGNITGVINLASGVGYEDNALQVVAGKGAYVKKGENPLTFAGSDNIEFTRTGDSVSASCVWAQLE